MGVSAAQEVFDELSRLVRCVFDDPVPDVGKAVHLGLRPGGDETLEALGREAPIAHAPDQ